MNTPRNHRVIKAKFLPPTNSRNSRIQLSENRFKKTERVTIPYRYLGDTKDQAISYLQSIGINVVGYGSDDNQYYVFSDSWGENFIEITGVKAE